MHKIKLFVLLSSLLCLTGCHSQPAQDISLYNPHPEINAANLVDSVSANIKSYPQEPLYFIFVNNTLCYYEILVNDIPVYSKFEQETVATPIVLNKGIVRSGEQTLTYRLYPYGKTFADNTNFSLSMEVMDNQKGMKSSREILSHKASHTEMRGSNKDIAMQIFDGEGKDYYEHTITFQAQVPYQIEGWTKGQDLRKLNQDSLYAAVMDYYTNYKKIYENQDANLLAGLIYESLIETSQERYNSKEDIDAIWKEHNGDLKSKDKDFYSMDKTIMKLYGNGRIVTLYTIPEDISYTDWSALMFKYNDEGDTMIQSVGLYLYLPQGEKDLRKLKKAI